MLYPNSLVRDWSRLVLQQEQRKFRKQFYLERLQYWERFLKSKATGCGSISTVFSSIVLLCVSSIINTIHFLNITQSHPTLPNSLMRKFVVCHIGFWPCRTNRNTATPFIRLNRTSFSEGPHESGVSRFLSIKTACVTGEQRYCHCVKANQDKQNETSDLYLFHRKIMCLQTEHPN